MASLPLYDTNDQTLIQQQPIAANADAVSVDPEKKKNKRIKKRKAVQSEDQKEDPKKRRIQSQFPISDASPQTGPFQHRGRGHGVDGGGYMPSHSFEPAISSAPGLPVTAINGHQSEQIPTSQSSLTDQPKKVQKSEKSGCPSENVYKTCELCDVKCLSKEDYHHHIFGRKHLSRLTKTNTFSELCDVECPSHPSEPAISSEPGVTVTAINGHLSGQIPTPQLNLTDQPEKVQKFEKTGCPTQTVYKTCELCDVKCLSKEDYHSHISGKKHLLRLTKTNTSPELCDVEYPSRSSGPAISSELGVPVTAINGHLRRQIPASKVPASKKHLSKLTKPKSELSYIKCELCDVKTVSEVFYQQHITGRKHIAKLWFASEVVQQIVSLSGILGLQTSNPPDINALSNAINAQIERGDNNPQARYGQLLLMVLSKVPSTEPVRHHTSTHV
ncbi:hypothetical protein Fmac_012024 [Flemingia macrophylla]|uniref:U1-type domain-containing protein n=1 Tax=Flemingia macrophylla TaxID=520843 RepID=A0ABD1MPY5_9FABA